MSGQGANPIFFNKKENWTSRTLTKPHPLGPITSHFRPPQIGRHMCITPNKKFA